MKVGHYPTSGDVTCFINGIWVDDMVRVEYSEQNPKVPLFSYHGKHMADTADGKLLITGSMVVNYRMPGYLMRALDNQAAEDGTTRHYVAYTNERESEVSEALKLIMSSAPETRARIMAELNPAVLNHVSRLMNLALFNPAPTVSFSPAELGPADSWQGAKGFNLEIYYGNIWSETIEGIHVTSVQKVINGLISGGDLGGSGQALLEVYTFIAKRVGRYGPSKLRNVEGYVANEDIIEASDYNVKHNPPKRLSELLGADYEGL